MYDLCVPPGGDPALFHPKPLDGEVESFEVSSRSIFVSTIPELKILLFSIIQLLPLAQVIDRMRSGLFKRNCALGEYFQPVTLRLHDHDRSVSAVLVDFMIRHGYLTAEDDPDFLEIMTRLHGRFDYENW